MLGTSGRVTVDVAWLWPEWSGASICFRAHPTQKNKQCFWRAAILSLDRIQLSFNLCVGTYFNHLICPYHPYNKRKLNFTLPEIVTSVGFWVPADFQRRAVSFREWVRYPQTVLWFKLLRFWWQLLERPWYKFQTLRSKISPTPAGLLPHGWPWNCEGRTTDKHHWKMGSLLPFTATPTGNQVVYR